MCLRSFFLLACLGDRLRGACVFIDILVNFSRVQGDRDSLLADAVIAWMPALPGMTGRKLQLAKVLPIL